MSGWVGSVQGIPRFPPTGLLKPAFNFVCCDVGLEPKCGWRQLQHDFILQLNLDGTFYGEYFGYFR